MQRWLTDLLAEIAIVALPLVMGSLTLFTLVDVELRPWAYPLALVFGGVTVLLDIVAWQFYMEPLDRQPPSPD